ncbi:hypothetical protein [Lysobacter gummosus]|uniref:Uncharacterized protein n=1 Tax=Lysobacter gummosus TaxID=262324 RepID=A0ABY3XAT3_9GAMM|nr:hypothetical protein [Lysobacter gummosus]UNP29718.1 hypothetical protein MOV92_00060 [Lysobacter gummosus]
MRTPPNRAAFFYAWDGLDAIWRHAMPCHADADADADIGISIGARVGTAAVPRLRLWSHLHCGL